MAEVLQQYVYVGKDQAQKTKIKCVADVAGSLGGKFFLFHEPDGTKHYAWFNTGASTDPAPAGGWTEHEITITSGDSGTDIAAELATVLGAVGGFDATNSGVEVILTCTENGYCQPARDAETVNKTGFTFINEQVGMLKENIGCIQGDIELSNMNAPNYLEVKCHASGTEIVQKIITGSENPELTFTLQDTSKEKLEKLFTLMGGTSTTAVGADKQKGFGVGTNLIGKAKPFIPVTLHPVKYAASDKSYDWNLWKCDISLDSIVFAAEDVSTLPMTITAYSDDSYIKEHSKIFIGNAADAILNS